MERPTFAPSHAETFRHAAPTRVGAYYVLLAGCALFAAIGIYPFPVRAIAATTFFETAVLLALFRHGAASPRWAALYLVVEAGCQTVIFYLSGDLRVAFAPAVYIFELLNPGLRLNRRGHFVVANGFVALFATMVVLEMLGGLPALQASTMTMSSALRAGTIVIVFLCLNVAAYFIAATRELLEAQTLELAYARQSLQEHSHALEVRVEERTRELERSYRELEAKSGELKNFVYNVTHDLKNPFNAILLNASLLLRRENGTVDAETRGDLEQMARTASHGENMLRDLLELFRVTSSQEASGLVGLDTVVREALDTLGPAIAKRQVRVEVGPLPTVQGRARKLRHMVENLLSNAVKYAPAGEGIVHVSGEHADGCVTLRVRDNGVGIPPAYHRRIFELFARVPVRNGEGPPAEGTGVGLALVKRIVEEHGGEVWVESTLGAGSTFVVRLPMEAPPSPADGSRA
jgi:signal transduction histidine kinase